MSEIKEIKTLEELIEVVTPRSIFVAIEMEKHPIGDEENAEGKADHAVRAMSIVERIRSAIDKGDIINGAVVRLEADEGNAEITPRYAFTDPKQSWTKAITSDIAFIYRLDGKIELVRGGDVKPYTLLD